MSRKKNTETTRTRTQSRKFKHGELLREAMSWIVNDDMFTDIKLHGNIKWQPKQLVMLAVLWVWSEKNTLTKAFRHAKHLALSMFGAVAVTTYQGLTGALKTWTNKLLPLIQQRMDAQADGRRRWSVTGRPQLQGFVENPLFSRV